MLGQASAGSALPPVSLRPKLPVKSVAPGPSGTEVWTHSSRKSHERRKSIEKTEINRGTNNPLGRKGVFELASLICKRNQTNQLQPQLLPSGPGGRRFKSSLPAQLYSSHLKKIEEVPR